MLQRTLAWLLLLVAPALAAPGSASDLPIEVFSVPPNVLVFQVDGEHRRLLPVDEHRLNLVHLDGPRPHRLTLELVAPGYATRRIEVTNVPERGPLRLPAESGSFVRMVPRLIPVRFESDPSDAEVSWIGSRGEERLGRTNADLNLSLGRMQADRGQLRFAFDLPGYHPETVTVGLAELQKERRVGPVRLRALFPLAPAFFWLVRRPAVAAITAVLLLFGILALIQKLFRDSRSR